MCPGISHSDSAIEDVSWLVPGGLGIIHFTSRSESMKFSKMVVCAAWLRSLYMCCIYKTCFGEAAEQCFSGSLGVGIQTTVLSRAWLHTLTYTYLTGMFFLLLPPVEYTESTSATMELCDKMTGLPSTRSVVTTRERLIFPPPCLARWDVRVDLFAYLVLTGAWNLFWLRLRNPPGDCGALYKHPSIWKLQL